MSKSEPYKGLRPYEEQDEKNFFGREAETRILIDKILTRKLTLLFAGSGVGKSSLLQAAVLPTLKRPAPPSHQGLDVVYCNDWVQNPAETLKQTVEKTLKKNNKLPDDYQLNHDLSLLNFLRTCTLFSSDPLVLILDQFEEFFNYQRYKSDFIPFITELSNAIGDRDTATAFVISMREDFALELNAFKSRMPTSLFDNYYRLESLSREKAKPVILEPLKHIGYDCEPELLQALLKDLSERQIGEQDLLEDAPLRVEPPYLQMICTQLWELENADFNKSISEWSLRTSLANDETQKELQIQQFEAELAAGNNKNIVLVIISNRETTIELTIAGYQNSDEFNTLIIADTEHELITELNLEIPDEQKIIALALSALGYHYNKLRLSTYKAYGRDEGLLDRYFKSRIAHLNGPENRRASLAFNFLVSSQGTKMAYPLPELERRTGITASGSLAKVLNKLEDARILRSQQRLITDQSKQLKPILYYELYHDLFATPINAWNSEYKNRRRNWQAILGVVATLVVGLLLRGGYSVLIQSSSHHLRLSEKTESEWSDNIELWGGTREELDLLTQKVYQTETRFDKAEIEADKLFTYKPVADYDQLNLKLISQFPLVERFVAYQQAGLWEKAEELATNVFKENREHREKIASALLMQRTSGASKLISQYFETGPDQALKSSLIEGLAEYPSIQFIKILQSTLGNKKNNNIHYILERKLTAYAGQPGSKQAIALLIGWLGDSDEEVLDRTVETLAAYAEQAGSELAIAPLVELLEAPYVGSSAAKTLAAYAGQAGSELAIAPLVEMLKKSYVGSSAAETLVAYAGQPGSELAISPLVELLKDSYVGDTAARTLAAYGRQPGSELAISPLVELLKDSNQNVRSRAAETLAAYAGQSGSELAIAPLVELLKDSDGYVVKNVKETLAAYAGQPGSEQAFALLVGLLKDPDQGVRYSAVVTLAAYARQPGSELAIAPLVELLKDSKVRDMAVVTLAAYAGQPDSEQVITPLVELLKDSDGNFHNQIAYTLVAYAGQPGSEQAIAPLVELLKDSDGYFSSTMATKLTSYAGQPGSKLAISLLVELLKDPDSDQNVRYRAVKTLASYAGQPGSEQAIAPLIGWLKDKNFGAWAAETLAAYAGQPGSELAIVPLVELLECSDKKVCNKAAETLAAYAGQSGSELAIAPLVELLKDSDEYFVKNVKETLAAYAGQPGSELAFALLVGLLKDSNVYGIHGAAEILAAYAGQPGSEQAIAPLVGMLNSYEYDVYTADRAAETLAAYAGQPGSEQAIAPLVELLKDGSGITASEAETLTAYAEQPGSEQAIPRLVELLKSSDGDVRNSVAETLAAYAGPPGSQQAIAALVELLNSSNLNFRVSATQLLGNFAGHSNIYVAEKPLTELLISEHKELRFHSSMTLALIRLNRTESSSPENKPQLSDKETKHLLEQFYTLEKDEQLRGLPALSRIPSQLILDELLQQEEQSKDHETRTSALHALGQSLAKQSSVQVLQRLQAIANDQQEPLKIRIYAVKALGYSSVDTTPEFLIKLVKGEPRLINAIYVALDRLNSPKSLAFLQESLSKQEQRHQQWRDKREQWQEDFNAEDQNTWKKQLQDLQPNQALETWLARQIARQDETEAFKLLRHNLYGVRKGAWLGISQQYFAKMVGTLMEQHAHEEHPLFRYALYRALDRLLQRLEITGSEDDFKILKNLSEEWKPRLKKIIELEIKNHYSEKVDVQKTMLERINWTIPNLQSRINLRQ